MRAVYNIQPKRSDTHRTRLTVVLNIIDYPGEVSTPISDLTNIKIHVNSAISYVKTRYMCMEVKDFLPEKPDVQGRTHIDSDFNDTTGICGQI